MDEIEQQLRLTGSLGEETTKILGGGEIIGESREIGEARKLIKEMTDKELDELWGLSEVLSLMVTNEKGRRMCER